jgi:hypothetical protein
MGHQGYYYSRRSYHSLKDFAECPRKAFLRQVYGVEVKMPLGGWKGPLARGKMYHTYLEVFFQHEKKRGLPTAGTDGNPILRDAKDVFEFYMQSGEYNAEALHQAETGYKRFLSVYRGSSMLQGTRRRILGQTEPDLRTDFRYWEGRHAPEDDPANKKYNRMRHTFFDAQFDAIATAEGGGSVINVEHKLLNNIRPSVVSHYVKSGQLISQAAVWNGAHHRTSQWGRMESSLLNLISLKGSKVSETMEVYLDPLDQERMVKTIVRIQRELDLALRRSQHDYGDKTMTEYWPMRGLCSGACVDYFGSSCKFLHVCKNNRIPAELFTISDSGLNRLQKDRVINLDPSITVVPTKE